MGQTLTHGIYLPDEGERNCYAGLAANWNILDGAVGTVADHTTALSGKAPLVHTHTKSDITDFPAYGNAAGTICEGNDSRLSDARTPVAHTHTKSDVTDLLNSDFIPSANDSYNLGSSSYQWKTLNGINPGALSIPNMGSSAAAVMDITSWYIQDPDFPDDPTKKIIDDSVEHTVSSDVPGWVHIAIPNVAGNFAYARQYAAGGNMSDCRIADGLADYIMPHIFLIFPIVNSLQIRIKAKSATVRIFPCLGNV